MRILFFDRSIERDILLKATTTKTVIVPAHTRKDGRFVAPYAKIVHYNPDVPMEDVIAGKGSHSQKLAHKKLHAKVPGFANLPGEEQGIHILSSGTNIQKKASLSAAISGWAASLIAGKKPSKSQAEAYAALKEKNPQAAYDKQKEVVNVIGVGKFAELASTFVPLGVPYDESGGKKDAALQSAIDHLKEDAKQGDLPAHEKKEDAALVEKLEAAKAPANPLAGKPAYDHVAQVAKKTGGDMQTIMASSQDWLAANPGGEDELSSSLVDLGYLLVAKHMGIYKPPTLPSESKPAPLHTFNGANGMQSTVVLGDGGKYHVVIQDLDSGEYLPTIEIHNKESDAVDRAKFLVGIKDSPEVAENAVASAKLKEIADGHGGHYPGIAHKKLKNDEGWKTLSPKLQLEAVVTLAKELQQAANASAAVSMWKKAALAGKNPAPAQWMAFQVLADDKKSALLDDVKAKHGGWGHLKQPAATVLLNATKPADPFPTFADHEKADKKVILPVGPKDGDTKAGADGKTLVFKNGRWHKYVDADESGELPAVLVPVSDGGPASAIASSIAEPITDSDAALPAKKYLLKEEDFASSAIGVSGQEMTSYVVASGEKWLAANPGKEAEVNSALDALGYPLNKPAADVSVSAVEQLYQNGQINGNEKAFSLKYLASHPGDHKGLYTALADNGWDNAAGMVESNGAMFADKKMSPKEYGAAAFAAGKDKAPILDTDFWDAHAGASGAPSAASLNDWLAGYTAASLNAPVPDAAQPSANQNPYMAKFSGTPVADFVTTFKIQDKAGAGKPISELLDPPEIAAFDALSQEDKMDVAGAIGHYGPAKLKLFTDWLAEHNAKPKLTTTFGADHPDQVFESGSYQFKFDGQSDEWKWKYKNADESKWVVLENDAWASSLNSGKMTNGDALVPVSKPSPQGENTNFATYHNTSDGHSKFWSVCVQGESVITKYGKIGAKGTSTVKELGSNAAAHAEMHKLIKQKSAKGYVLHSGNVAGLSTAPVSESVDPVAKKGFDTLAEMAAIGDSAGLNALKQTLAYNPPGSPNHEYAKQKLAELEYAPKEGDTKQGADGMLVFKGGRWHKVFTGKKLTDAEINAAAAWPTNKHATAAKAAAKAGDLAKLKEVYLAAQSSAKFPKTAAKIVKLMELVSGQKTFQPTSAPQPAAQPSQPAAPSSTPPEPKVIFSNATKDKNGGPSVTSMAGWVKTGDQKGSNPGGTFKDKNGQSWYVKFPATEDHCKNELLASKLYKAAGVDVPNLRLVSKDGKVGIASKIVDGVSKVGAGIKSAPGALEGFAVDAWLGNYDSVGTGYDNLLKTKDGKAIRIDVGGSLLYRAQGAPKGDSFGTDVVELDGMRDKAKNSYGAAVFGGISKDQLIESVALVLDVPDDVIKQMVDKFGPGSASDKAALATKLIARKSNLAKKFPEADLIANPPKPDPRKLPVEPAKLPTVPNFMNWGGGGKGLSGNDKVNQANQAAVNEIYASAMKGDFLAIKKLKYHVVDKSTGETKEADSFGAHPSQHVRDFYSTIVDYMEVIANPAAKKMKAWDIEDYSDINELSDAFKAHFYGVTVGDVPANQRLGFWISLGQAETAAPFVPKNIAYTSGKDKTKGKASTQAMPGNLKKWMSAVKSSGSANQPYRDGKEIDNQGQKTRDVLKEAYAHSVEFEEGTRITKFIDFPPAMKQQMLDLPEGHVFQNPGSMCCSLKENWGWSGGAKLNIIYAKGAKALYNIGVGSFDSEGEITTIPGQRFMLLEKKTNQHQPEYTLLMLPPDETYVENIHPKS